MMPQVFITFSSLTLLFLFQVSTCSVLCDEHIGHPIVSNVLILYETDIIQSGIIYNENF